MKLPRINDISCPSPEASACPTGTDGTDPTTLLPTLILKPSLLTMCAEGTVQFSAFLRSAAGEALLTSGLTFSSSNSASVAINPVTGLATILSAGIVTISVQWQEMFAYSQMTVLGGATCCDDIKVGTVLVIDNSLSMSLPFGGSSATLLAAAKNIAVQYIAALLAKDVMAASSFNSTPTLLIDLTGDTAELTAAVQAITIDPAGTEEGDTNIPDALALAINTANACATCDRKVIVLFSDGRNRPPLGSADYSAMLAAADAFKASGGVIITVGIRAAGDGYALLQQLATGGFFVNAVGTIDFAVQALLCLLGYYCAGSRPPSGQGYACITGYNCCDEPPGEQPPDPTPLADNETPSTGGLFTSTKTECATCPPDLANIGGEPIINSDVTGYTFDEGVISASSELRPAWWALARMQPGWQSSKTASYPQWLQVRFAHPQIVGSYQFWGVSGITGGPGDPEGFVNAHWQFQGSNDGTTWTTLDEQTTEGFPFFGAVFFVANPASYLYYRMYFPADNTDIGSRSVVVVSWTMFGEAAEQQCATATAQSLVSQADADSLASAAALQLAQSRLNCQGSNNTAPIVINDDASGSPYPSLKAVTGMSGSITKVTATLKKLSHTFPADIQVVLQSPTGKTCQLMWHVGGPNELHNVDLAFDDAAANSLPVSSQITSGTYKPTQDGVYPRAFAPAPVTPYGSSLAVFIGDDPNGLWRLWVCDQRGIDAGRVDGGWDIQIAAA